MSRKGSNCIVKPCPNCGGKLYWDPYEEEFCCHDCSRRYPAQSMKMASQPNSELPQSADTSTQSKRQEGTVSAPVAETHKQPVPRYYPYSKFSTNGAWYPINQITFRREHMIFLIKSLPLLQEGKYPPNPIGTGYVDSQISRKGGKPHSYFESPGTLAAEVEQRLELCGQDGLILEALFCWEKRPEYLMRVFNLDEHKLERRINSALAYISGWWRKKRSYKAFRSHKRAVS